MAWGLSRGPARFGAVAICLRSVPVQRGGHLNEIVILMGRHQLGRKLTPAEVASIVAFLGALTGDIDAAYTAKPVLPASGPDTPGPDPS